MLPTRLSAPAAFIVGAVLFVAMAGATEGLRRLGFDSPAQRHVAIKLMMLVLSIGLMLAIGRPRRAWGLVAPRRWITSTLVPTLAGGAVGAAATATILGLDLPPMHGLRELGFLRIVAIIWFGSTLAEELFVRGLIQGWMQPISPTDATDALDATNASADSSAARDCRDENGHPGTQTRRVS